MRTYEHAPSSVRSLVCACALLAVPGCTSDGGVGGTKLSVDELGIFELDGNAADSPAGAPFDWSTIQSLFPGDMGAPPNLVANTGVVADPDVAPTASVLSTGGSKDNNDFDQWVHQLDGTPSPQDKDKITNAYAAAFEAAGDLIIYFGADRFAQNGDAHLGFWFLQGQLTPLADGSFDGLHVVGDVLVQANFVNGGATELIEVYEWVGSGGSHGPLDLLFSSTDAQCVTTGAPGAQLACAITNPGPTAAPWAYTPKFGASGTFPQDAFFEGGINLTQIFAQSNPGQPLPCFATFLAETRSSHPFDSTLRDYVLHEFPVCSLRVEKTCDDGQINTGAGDPFLYTYSVVVTNDGLGTLFDLTISDPTTGLSDTLAELAPGGTWEFLSQTFDSTSSTGVMNTVTVGAATTDGGPASITVTDTAACPTVEVEPALSIVKTCTTTLVTDTDGHLEVRVGYTVEVCNVSNPPVFDLVNVDVVNDPGTPSDPSDDVPVAGGTDLTIAPGATNCVVLNDTYFPTSATGTNITFTDTVTATGESSLGTTDPDPVSDTASCDLCPAPAE